MSKRRDPNPEFDFFIPLMNDFPLKDQREVMERPFFSLQKRKRLRLRTHSQKMTVAARQMAEKKTVGHLS